MRKIAIVTVSVFAAAVVGTAATAATGWTSARSISPVGHSPRQASAEVDGQGNARFVWDDYDGATPRILTRFRSASGVLGDVEEVASVGIKPEFAMAPNGFAAFTWISQEPSASNLDVRARVRTPAGVLRKTHMLSLPADPVDDTYQPQVAVDDRGNATFAWVISDESTFATVQTRSLSINGSLGPIQNLSAVEAIAGDPRVAVDADGDAVFAWADSNGSRIRIAARVLARDGTLGPSKILSTGGAELDPDVAIDSEGNAIVAWQWFDGDNYVIQLRARPADGAFGPIEIVSESGQDASHPDVAIDGAGDALIAWQRPDGELPGDEFERCCDRVQSRERSSTGALGAIETLSYDGVKAHQPDTALNAEGRGIVGWLRFGLDGARIQVVTRSPGGVFGKVTTLSSASTGASGTDVAIGPDGDMVGAWLREDDTHRTRLQASFGP